MGLLTILKKMKQKEKEVRLLMLYPFETNINGLRFSHRHWNRIALRFIY